MTEAEVLSLLQTECTRCGSQAAFAREAGVTKAHISQVLLGRKPIGPTILSQLGLVKVVSFVPKISPNHFV